MQFVITSTVALISAFAGLFVGNALTRSRERKNWLRDKSLEEFKELLSSIAAVLMLEVLIDVHKHRILEGQPFDRDEAILASDKLLDARNSLARVRATSIFTAERCKQLGIDARFTRANALLEGGDLTGYAQELDLIRTHP